MALLDAFRSRKWLRTATDLESGGTTESKAFLDKVGLATFWAKIMSTFATKAEVEAKADQATTLAGYGITDAKISDGTITLGANSITPITSHQSLKTINGNSLIGSGDLEISADITIDTAMSGTSTNPVQNKVITSALDTLKTALDDKADKVTWQELTAEEVQANGLTLDPYTHYVIPDFDSDYFEMHINSFPDRTSENFLKPCFVQFYVGSGLDFSFTYPTGLFWANGELPTFEDDTWYQLSIVGGCAVCTKFATV